jgi:hypothetical protein
VWLLTLSAKNFSYPTDSHIITFACDRHFGLVDRNQWGWRQELLTGRDEGVLSIVVLPFHGLHLVSISLRVWKYSKYLAAGSGKAFT